MHVRLDDGKELTGSPPRSFQEALQVTTKAKAAYTHEGLFNRGKNLILESVKCGVTAMRAHVEVDRTVQFQCIDVGLQLKNEFKEICDINLAGGIFFLSPFRKDD